MLLDDEKTIARIDSGKVRASIESLPDQIASAFAEASRIRVPASYKNIDQVVVAGMGGSSLPADMVKSVYGSALRVPFSFINDYKLPGSVGKKSVVILSSYSGTTEETLACLKDALKRGAKIMGIAAGGPLAKMLKRAKAPAYIFDPAQNPSRQPRMGLGYMAVGLLVLLDKINAITVDPADLGNLADRVRAYVAEYAARVPMRTNMAKLMAHALLDTVPVVVSAEHLSANGHILQNQINESAKQFCVAFPLPELNHHLMEGLKFPKEFVKRLAFLFIGSDLYSDRLARRVLVTEKVVAKQGLGYNSWNASDRTRLGQTFETLVFGSWVSFYMAMQNRANPSDIPWVDFFKKELARG
jgi:glucose/mannose-6-phosphate isomerase